MREFNVGDKVKCIDAIGSINRELKNGETDIVSHVDTNGFVKLKGLSSYYYDPSRFKKIEYTYEDLKKAPIGTKITFENGEEMIKCSAKRYENGNKWRAEKDFARMEDKIGTLGKITKIEEPTYQTVFETKADILDETEKRYLSNIIKPFKKVKSIRKYIFSDKKQACIVINVFNLDESYWTISLPPFKKDTMYKEMEDNKEYTLEELGL